MAKCIFFLKNNILECWLFPPIFVAGTKIFNGYNFVAPLTNQICYCQIKFCSYYKFRLNQMSDIREV